MEPSQGLSSLAKTKSSSCPRRHAANGYILHLVLYTLLGRPPITHHTLFTSLSSPILLDCDLCFGRSLYSYGRSKIYLVHTLAVTVCFLKHVNTHSHIHRSCCLVYAIYFFSFASQRISAHLHPPPPLISSSVCFFSQ